MTGVFEWKERSGTVWGKQLLQLGLQPPRSVHEIGVKKTSYTGLGVGGCFAVAPNHAFD